MDQSSHNGGEKHSRERACYPNLRHIRLLGAAIRLHSLSAAAATVHISQPAASQAVAKLKHFFGSELLERSGNGVAPSADGEIVNRRGARALDHLRDAGRRLAVKSGAARGQTFDVLERNATITHLRALSAFAEMGSFSAAARLLGQAEPSLQRAARDLERVVDVPLFGGAYRTLHLTTEGEILAAHASLALKELHMAREEVRERAGVFDGLLSIGTLPLVRTRIVPSAVVETSDKHKMARIEVMDGPYESLIHQLNIGRLDLIVGALRDEKVSGTLRQEPLFQDELSVIARAGHPLANARTPDAAQLGDYPWVVARQGTPNRSIFDGLALEFGEEFASHGFVETGSLVTLRGVLLQSDHLTLLSPKQVEYELQSGLLCEIDFALAGTERSIGMTTRADWQPTALQADFVAALKQAAISPQARIAV